MMYRVDSRLIMMKHMYNKEKLKILFVLLNEIKKELNMYYINRKLTRQFASLKIDCISSSSSSNRSTHYII